MPLVRRRRNEGFQDESSTTTATVHERKNGRFVSFLKSNAITIVLVLGTIGGGLAILFMLLKSKGSDSDESSSPQTKTYDGLDWSAFREAASEKRTEFQRLYGGKEAAESMVERGTIPYGMDELRQTAKRLLRSRETGKPFVMSFGGYSVTTGRGNRFEQSFPFVAERVLTEPLKRLGVDLIVRNAGQGGIPSIPFAFCLRNFLGSDADVVSWDFRFNEGIDSSSFESYLRHAMALPKEPKFILMAKRSPSRKKVIRTYVDEGALFDPLVVDVSYPPEHIPFLDMDEKDRPEGFQNFDEWGAPGSPGQEGFIPKYKWHQMIGWIVAMHILDAAQVASEMVVKGEASPLPKSFEGDMPRPRNHPEDAALSREATVLFGKPADASDPGGVWKLNRVSCSTTFSPTVEGTPLTDLVLSGVQGGETDVSEGAELDKGWILGFGSAATREEHTKYKEFGFVDTKISLHGVHTSGTLKLWIPWGGARASSQRALLRANDGVARNAEATVIHSGSGHRAMAGDSASSWFENLLVCQYYETYDNSSCDIANDVKFAIGGKDAESVHNVEVLGAQWRNKPFCVHVDIPKESKVSRKSEIVGFANDQIKAEEVGITLDVTVTNTELSAIQSPCSVSHIIWQDATGGSAPLDGVW